MIHKYKKVHAKRTKRVFVLALSILLGVSLLLTNQQNATALRFTERSLYVMSSVAGETTPFHLRLTYPTVNTVGSLRLEFCTNPFPYMSCDRPTGLDVSGTSMVNQTGETGYTIGSLTENEIVLSRPPSITGLTPSLYSFSELVNPTGPPQTYYVRIHSYASSDASGPSIDFASVTSSTNQEVGLVTQVPPVLIFCVAEEIPVDCSTLEGDYFADFGELQPDQTYTATSQMMAFTNATNGYAIVALGRTLTSGIHEIEPLTTPTEIALGEPQFGINLTANTNPAIGEDPVGPGVSAVLNSDYTQPDRFLFNNGDILVTSDGVTLNRKYTVSYVLNVPEDQHPGVYNTTISYICTASF